MAKSVWIKYFLCSYFNLHWARIRQSVSN